MTQKEFESNIQIPKAETGEVFAFQRPCGW
jgi:hypothetical protein